jgi:hypothetical protein
MQTPRRSLNGMRLGNCWPMGRVVVVVVVPQQDVAERLFYTVIMEDVTPVSVQLMLGSQLLDMV